MSRVKRAIAPLAFAAALLATPAWSTVTHRTTATATATTATAEQSSGMPGCISCWGLTGH